ncbi:MAG: asparaginase domain-containing protein, partial [Nanoarchaeota archaeon]
MAKPGDRVKVSTKKGAEEGILMPSSDKNTVILKVDNGYNIGFEKKEVTKMSVIKTKETKNKPLSKIARNPNLPTIAILHTGGTIASKVDYRTGGVASEFSPEELISLFPELQHIANIESELIAQMWSDDLRFAHFSLIAKAIERQVKKGVKGIIIGMGTDNLAVAA